VTVPFGSVMVDAPVVVNVSGCGPLRVSVEVPRVSVNVSVPVVMFKPL